MENHCKLLLLVLLPVSVFNSVQSEVFSDITDSVTDYQLSPPHINVVAFKNTEIWIIKHRNKNQFINT